MREDDILLQQMFDDVLDTDIHKLFQTSLNFKSSDATRYWRLADDTAKG